MNIERQYAIQSRTTNESERVAFIVENMAKNKAYRHATADGDQNGEILESFRTRYLDYRKAWRSQPKQAIERNLAGKSFNRSGLTPLCVDIEVAAVCDLACPFCFRQHIVTPDAVIESDLYRRLIDQCVALEVPSIKLNWRGEPLLHPKLPEFIDYAKRRGILEVIINTNATTLDGEKSRSLIQAGLDQMIYSFDGGTKDTYESMRINRFGNKHSFESVYRNIKHFKEIRDELGAVFPRTKIQMILTEKTFNERNDFVELFEDCVDDVSLKAYTERGGRLQDLDKETRQFIELELEKHNVAHSATYWRDMSGNMFVSKGRLPCEQPFQRLIVTYDGRASMCCYDWGSEHPVGYTHEAGYLTSERDQLSVKRSIDRGRAGFSEFMGSARLPNPISELPEKVETLEQLWKGAAINDVRDKHCSGKIEDIKICCGCPFKETYDWIPIGHSEPALEGTTSK